MTPSEENRIPEGADDIDAWPSTEQLHRLARELGQQDTIALFDGDTVPRKFVIGRETCYAGNRISVHRNARS